jgi:glycosyltransferase involved in cell wall biosynthesis
VLIVTDDVLTEKMAGPAIRAWQIAEALSGDHPVVLATTSSICERHSDRFVTEAGDQIRFAELERWCDVIILQGYVLHHVPVLRLTDRVMVVDLYDPLHLETLELTRHQPEPDRSRNVASSVRILNEQLRRGDFFVCASDKQRDLWLGHLSAVGRINPATYAADPSLHRLIDIVPFGLPDDPPVHTRAAIRGVVPGIGPDDEVLLWGGGVYDWLDPVTLIRAVDKLRMRRPTVRLYFLGVRHPKPEILESRALSSARSEAEDLGLTGTHVFFNEGWVAYEDRENYLLEADVGVSLHFEHIETAFSFRTRILDYLWASLPIVATSGDSFAELIAGEDLGRVVPAGDVTGVEQALFDVLEHRGGVDRYRERAEAVRRRYKWSQALRPLVEFCVDPHRAADAPEAPPSLLPLLEAATDRSGPWAVRRRAGTAVRLYRDGGVQAVWATARGHIFAVKRTIQARRRGG